MQNNNLLKKAMLALLLCMAMPCVNAQMAHIGDILCEGDLIVSPANYNANTHTAIGVVFYVDQTGQHGWAVALQDAGSYKWAYKSNAYYVGEYVYDTPLPNYDNNRSAVYDLDGYENTGTIRSEYFPAFYAVDYENGWYLPAIGQWNYLYGNLVEVNASLLIAGGSKISGWEYWSSSEYSWTLAWHINSSGDLRHDQTTHSFNNNKDVDRTVRAARNF